MATPQKISIAARNVGAILAPRTSHEPPPDTGLSSDEGTTLPDLFDRVFPPATPAEWATAESALKAVFGTKDENGVWSDEAKFDVLKSLAEEENWSGKRLIAQIRHFLKTYEYPEWKPSDVFATKSTRVYGQSWYEEQCLAGRGAQVERWGLPGQTKIFYRMADGQTLPPPFFRVEPRG